MSGRQKRVFRARVASRARQGARTRIRTHIVPARKRPGKPAKE